MFLETGIDRWRCGYPATAETGMTRTASFSIAVFTKEHGAHSGTLNDLSADPDNLSGLCRSNNKKRTAGKTAQPFAMEKSTSGIFAFQAPVAARKSLIACPTIRVPSSSRGMIGRRTVPASNPASFSAYLTGAGLGRENSASDKRQISA